MIWSLVPASSTPARAHPRISTRVVIHGGDPDSADGRRRRLCDGDAARPKAAEREGRRAVLDGQVAPQPGADPRSVFGDVWRRHGRDGEAVAERHGGEAGDEYCAGSISSFP